MVIAVGASIMCNVNELRLCGLIALHFALLMGNSEKEKQAGETSTQPDSAFSLPLSPLPSPLSSHFFLNDHDHVEPPPSFTLRSIPLHQRGSRHRRSRHQIPRGKIQGEGRHHTALRPSIQGHQERRGQIASDSWQSMSLSLCWDIDWWNGVWLVLLKRITNYLCT